MDGVVDEAACGVEFRVHVAVGVGEDILTLNDFRRVVVVGVGDVSVIEYAWVRACDEAHFDGMRSIHGSSGHENAGRPFGSAFCFFDSERGIFRK